MHVILDSDVIIECLRGNKDVLDILTNLSEKGALISYTAISLAEIYAGIRKNEEKAISDFFLNIHFIAFNEEMGMKAGEYLKNFTKSCSVEIADALIAAAASKHKASLFTRNKKHYPMKDVEFLTV